jgi:hypothetical protein
VGNERTEQNINYMDGGKDVTRQVDDQEEIRFNLQR